MARTDLSKGILSRYERLEGQRQNWETHWQEVADYMQPRKADVTKTRARGDKRNELIFDSSPIQAVELLAASLHGMLTNPATPWFTLRFKEEDIDNEEEAKIWLESATDTTAVAETKKEDDVYTRKRKSKARGRSMMTLTSAQGLKKDDNLILGRRSLLGS